MSELKNKIQELEGKILEDIDKLLFEEAAICLESEAYRAAYIMIWICGAESLKEKFKKLASRDREASTLVGEISKLERNGDSTDRIILNNVEMLGITNNDKRKLEYILDRRNIYAHPTGSLPLIEEVLAAFANVVDVILSKPPLLRHGYANYILKSIFTNKHFLEDNTEKIKEYAEDVANRLSGDVLPWIFENICIRIEGFINDPEKYIFKKRGLTFGTTLLTKADVDFSNSQWSLIEILQSYPLASSMILSEPTLFTKLNDQQKYMVVGNLIEPVLEGRSITPSEMAIKQAYILYSNQLLNENQVLIIENYISTASYSTLRDANIPLEKYAKRIINDLKSHTWPTQNPAATALRLVGSSECSKLPKELQEELGRNILQSADGTSRSSQTFIVLMLEDSQYWPADFIYGLLIETLVNEKNQFRFKIDFLGKALLATSKHPESKTIFSRATKDVHNSTSNYLYKDNYEKFKELVGQLIKEVDLNAILFLTETAVIVDKYFKDQQEAMKNVI